MIALSEDFTTKANADLAATLADTGQGWTTTGSGLNKIAAGRMTSLLNGYACINAECRPTRIYGVVSWLAGTPTGNAGVTLIASYKNFALSDMVHCFFQDTGSWGLQLRVAAGAFVGVLTGNTTPPVFGQPYPIGLRISGSTLTVELPDGTEQSIDDPRADMWGRLLTYQTGWNGTTAPQPGFLSLGAEGQRPPSTGLDY